jgi:protoporphyrinogen oxidase
VSVTAGQTKDVVVFGAGVAGLAAGYLLSRSGTDVLLIEGDSRVGGLAKTISYCGFRFDLGGHRFIPDTKEVENLVREVLDDDLLLVARASKILLRGRYLDYPLRPWNAFFGLGALMSLRIVLSYVFEQIKDRIKTSQIVSLEDWVVHQFGRTMFNIYFKRYSEKVWGVDCSRIAMEWVDQRIEGLSLAKAIRDALLGLKGKKLRTTAKTFFYPPEGIGQIADALEREVEKRGQIATNARIVSIFHKDSKIRSVRVRSGDKSYTHSAAEFISTIPLTALVRLLDPAPPAEVLRAASSLRFRDLVIVTIMVDRTRITDQSWIYIPDPEIDFGRIHEPTNWSKKMAPKGKSLLVTEHFCFSNDATWKASDQQLTERTVTSLVELGFIQRQEVIDSVVLRIPRAYPVFEVGYTQQYETICSYLSGFRNLQFVGRGGSFKYYNTDHAMDSGLAAAKTVINRNRQLLRRERRQAVFTAEASS